MDYLDDLDADFRAFYQIGGIADEQFGDLSAERFFALAYRTFAYRGVMRVRAQAELDQQPDQEVQQQPRQIGAGSNVSNITREQFAQQSYGQSTIPDPETTRQRLAAMGRG